MDQNSNLVPFYASKYFPPTQNFKSIRAFLSLAHPHNSNFVSLSVENYSISLVKNPIGPTGWKNPMNPQSQPKTLFFFFFFSKGDSLFGRLFFQLGPAKTFPYFICNPLSFTLFSFSSLYFSRLIPFISLYRLNHACGGQLRVDEC